METKMLTKILKTAALIGVLTSPAIATAADVYLKTQAFDKAMANGENVPMWGFSECTDGTFSSCQPADANGPVINANVGDALAIHLQNNLTLPVSIVIPGQLAADAGSPIMISDGLGRSRVRSMSHETSAGAVSVYNWNSLKAGSFIYQSGTEPSIQVVMGLIGALVVSDGTTYDAESSFLLSEVDPTQNRRVAEAATQVPPMPIQPACVPLSEYAQSATIGYPCSVDYNPMFLMLNGQPSQDMQLGDPGDTALVHFMNAGLRSHSPSLIGLDMKLIAEDGNPYPGLPRQHSSLLLPAGKSVDAVVELPEFQADGVTPGDATIALFDHMPGFNNSNDATGGSLASLQVGAGGGAPTVSNQVELNFSVVEDTATTLSLPGGSNFEILNSTASGSLTSVSPYVYTPNTNFSGVDGFTYYSPDDATTYHVTLNVSYENDAPFASADGPYVNTIGTDIHVAAPGIMGNDGDPDGDTLTAIIDSSPATGTLALAADGSFVYSGGTPGSTETFSYHVSDGSNDSNVVSVTLKVNPVAGVALNVIDDNGVAVSDFRWTMQEDSSWHPDPEAPPSKDILATNFHKSYMPPIAQGNGATEFAQLALDPTKHYYVSVLPADAGSGSGHSLGGAQVAPGTTSVSVSVNTQPMPTAQISIFVYEDNSPTNGSVDGAEMNQGLGSFTITLEEAGGRYGASGGPMLQDTDGNPLQNALDCFGASGSPQGIILSCPDTAENRAKGLVGQVSIKNLYPGKYGIIVTPTSGNENWIQTSTIEGTKVIDAWVKAGEPAYFKEFGPGGWHVFVGFIDPARLTLPAGGTNSVSGKVTNMHLSRPPLQTLVDSGSYDALAHTRAWVGLNSAGGNGENIAAVQADEDGSFHFDNIPDGLYQLVIWDSYLDQLISYKGVTLPGDNDVGNVPVFNWFARSEHNVYLDTNQNGVRDPGEEGIPEQAVNLRWRDGTINQSFPTDTEGFVPFDETFPFFHWQVLEVDYARFKPTGLTVMVDAGGDVSTGPYPGILAPQQQGPCNQDDVDSGANGCTVVGASYADPNQRTELGPVLTEGFQGFMGQTSIFDWGKAPYAPGENGGISGIVYYASTRAENDPRLAVGEPWEPGIPRVKVRLYREITKSTGETGLAFVQETETDSWDDSLPSGCPGADPTDSVITGGPDDKCYDGLRNFNQVRPAVFDGGYAFMDIEPGKYVVEVVPPPGYTLVKEEDVNVSFGDVFANAPVALMLPGGGALLAVTPDPATVVASMAPEPGIAQPKCVGAERAVPDFLSLFPVESAEAPFAGSMRPLCDRKEVILSDQAQAAADFFLYTSAPIAGQFTGMILDDLAQEFNVYSPQFGEKWAPPFVPVSIRDYQGKEVGRVYSDQWGRYNGLLPSTFTANQPSPSGYSPAMFTTCMNDPGPIIDNRAGSPTEGQSIIDPQYNPGYSNFCYTMQFMPGTTTYLDTPVLPVSAFASGYNPAECSLDQGTPMIARVDGNGVGPLASPGGTVTISSLGNQVEITNPDYEGPLASGAQSQKTIFKDYSFGAQQGTGSVSLDGTPLTVVSWDENTIVAQVPNAAISGELVVTRDNGNSTEHAITLTVSNETPIRVSTGESIQAAIDSANAGDLILVEPGSYNEAIIMWKPIRLQGAGAGTTFINATTYRTESRVEWRNKMDCLFGIGASCTKQVDVLPTQIEGAGGFNTEEGAAITVVGINDPGVGRPPANTYLRGPAVARIDGFSVTGGDTGGGIFVNGYAHRLQISNNHIFGNNGLYGGGVRIGRPYLELTDEGPFGFNTRVRLHHNSITHNGGLGGAGGGLSLMTGTDSYRVDHNYLCGNFTTGDGGGIGHLGLSHVSTIENNKILFNQSFSQASSRSGGGIFISGEAPVVDGPTHGAGNVDIFANLIQGNHAGAGHGGGIRTQFYNGRDIVRATDSRGRTNPSRWYKIGIENNMIMNNVAGWSGGGISLSDTTRASIVNNTIAHNDSTSTVSATFAVGNPNLTIDQPAGIASEPYNASLNALIPIQGNTTRYLNFSNPTLRNNILWQNRSFHYDGTLSGGAGLVPVLSQTVVGECDAGANYSDLGVLGGAYRMDPRFSIITDTTGYNANNLSTDPALENSYCNGGRVLSATPGPMLALPAVDEAGATWIDVRFGPLVKATPTSNNKWDYHITEQSSAVDAGISSFPRSDFDGEARPSGVTVDIGADEVIQQ